MLTEIETAFNAYSVCTSIKFVRTEAAAGALVQVTFEDLSATNPHLFDVAGGNLSAGSANAVKLDASEHWCLASGPTQSELCFKVLPVVLHQVGHMLGMRHSENSTSIMYPFYDGGARCELTQEDEKV
jgi:predicted Zn-dependent protease